jgi:hypothetical protein
LGGVEDEVREAMLEFRLGINVRRGGFLAGREMSLRLRVVSFIETRYVDDMGRENLRAIPPRLIVEFSKQT